MAYKGSFKTAYLQREVVDVCTVNTAGKVGYLYSIGARNATTGVVPLTLLTTAPAANTKYAMIAQADQTMGYGHVPVENRDYKYVDTLAATGASTGDAAGKKVAYFIVDLNDITTVSV